MREVQNTGVSGYTNNRELDGCSIPQPSFSSLHRSGPMRLNHGCKLNSSENTVEREFPSPRSTAIYTVKAWRKRSIVVERGK